MTLASLSETLNLVRDCQRLRWMWLIIDYYHQLSEWYPYAREARGG
jgi:hypothetical protein